MSVTTIAVWDMANKRRYGSGSLRKRGKHWEIGYRLPSGKQKWETTNTTDRSIAEIVLEEKLLAVKKGQEDVLSDTKFETVATDWLASKRIEGVSPKTDEMFEQILRCHLLPFFGEKYLYEIKVATINDYRNKKLAGDTSLPIAGNASHKPLSPQTVKHHLGVLRQVYRYAMIMELTDRSPAELVANPSVKRSPIEPISPDDVKKIIANVSPDYKTLVFLLVTTGLRISEATGLRQADWDSKNKQLKIRGAIKRKGGKLYRSDFSKTAAGTRTLTVSDALAEKLDEQLVKAKRGKDPDGNKLLFGNRMGRPLNPSNFRTRQFIPAVKAAGLSDLRLHDLRHTWASEAISKNTMSQTAILKSGGWSSASSLAVYAHQTAADKDRESDTSDLYS